VGTAIADVGTGEKRPESELEGTLFRRGRNSDVHVWQAPK